LEKGRSERKSEREGQVHVGAYAGASILGVWGCDPQILGRGIVGVAGGRGRVMKYYNILSCAESIFESGNF